VHRLVVTDASATADRHHLHQRPGSVLAEVAFRVVKPHFHRHSGSGASQGAPVLIQRGCARPFLAPRLSLRYAARSASSPRRSPAVVGGAPPAISRSAARTDSGVTQPVRATRAPRATMLTSLSSPPRAASSVQAGAARRCRRGPLFSCRGATCSSISRPPPGATAARTCAATAGSSRPRRRTDRRPASRSGSSPTMTVHDAVPPRISGP
jgi:hypothetical protein